MKILFITLISCSCLFSVNKTGTTSAKFLSISNGAKSIGLGGAFTSIANDASALYWNPSGIARIHSQNFVFNHTEWWADIDYDFIGISLPLKNNHTLGFSIIYLSMGEMIVREYGNENSGNKFKAGSYALSTTWAMNLTDRFSIGFSGKFIREKISSTISSGVVIDVGTLFNTVWGPILGMSITNFGPKMSIHGPDLLVNADVSNIEGNNPNINAELSTDNFDLPLTLRVGLSDKITFSGIASTWSIDAVNPIDNSEYLNLGADINIWDVISFRYGINALFMESRESLFSAGLGTKFKINGNQYISFDYAYDVNKFLPSTHHFSIGFIR